MSKKISEALERDFRIESRGEDDDSRTIEIAFSSEEPYERYFGIEVLDHSPQSVRLDRLNGGAAVLVNHDSTDQVGVVESARIDDDKTGRAVVRFSRSQRGEEIYQDVKDGIRQLVSVGYRIHKYETEERDGLPDLVTARDWEPFEVSIVAIPADTSVGVGRSQIENADDGKTETLPETDNKEESIMSEETKKQEEKPAFDFEAERNKVRTEEKARVAAIRSMAEAHDVEELGREAIDNGLSAQEFNQKALEIIGERNAKARQESKHDGEVDLSQKERQSFSMLKLMDAISNPNDRAAQRRAEFELEVSAEAQRGFGADFDCRGEFVPESLLGGDKRDLSAGTATDGAELVATNLLAGSFIEVLRNSSAAMQAGMTVLSGLVGDVAIPRQTSGAASTWISAEDGDATEGEPQFDQVTLAPKDLACYTEVTRRLLQQSTPSVEALVRNDLARAQALGIDLAVFYGSGSSGQPTGIANATGIKTVDLAAADPTYAELINMIAKVMAANAVTGNPRFILEANGWEALSTTPKQGSGVEGNFILGDSGRVAGYPYTMSNQITDEHYFFGDFSQVILGEWGGLEMNVDPYTHSLKGKIRYITFKTCDIALRHPEAFCHAHDGIV